MRFDNEVDISFNVGIDLSRPKGAGFPGTSNE